MKIRILIFIMILALWSNIEVYAKDLNSFEMLEKLNITDVTSANNASTVTRGECIISVMRIIGLTDEQIKNVAGADFYAFSDVESYSYFGYAYITKIAFGEEIKIDYQTYRTRHTKKNTDLFFYPEREVKLKEIVAFMVRCLENSDDNRNVDLTFIKAKKYGLIKENDKFFNNPDYTINRYDYNLLLTRFLFQNRYKYYENTAENGMEAEIDLSNSMSYHDFLINRKLQTMTD